MAESIIEGLSNYFLTCPLLEDGVFRVDALGSEPVEYAIETGITSPVIRKYVDGSSIRQYQFNFNTREAYSLDRILAIQKESFYENFCNWVEEQSMNGNLPELPEGCEAKALTVLTPGYMLDATMTNAIYQVQLMLQYFKEAPKNE
ncbi:MAG: chloramphenicol resistance protein [Oscillospiraceae bacterium]|nr:chloramphenicol resistance protein [Oscillospiraceae bacterium]